jgi:hypothetical protein
MSMGQRRVNRELEFLSIILSLPVCQQLADLLRQPNRFSSFVFCYSNLNSNAKVRTAEGKTTNIAEAKARAAAKRTSTNPEIPTAPLLIEEEMKSPLDTRNGVTDFVIEPAEFPQCLMSFQKTNIDEEGFVLIMQALQTCGKFYLEITRCTLSDRCLLALAETLRSNEGIIATITHNNFILKREESCYGAEALANVLISYRDRYLKAIHNTIHLNSAESNFTTYLVEESRRQGDFFYMRTIYPIFELELIHDPSGGFTYSGKLTKEARLAEHAKYKEQKLRHESKFLQPPPDYNGMISRKGLKRFLFFQSWKKHYYLLQSNLETTTLKYYETRTPQGQFENLVGSLTITPDSRIDIDFVNRELLLTTRESVLVTRELVRDYTTNDEDGSERSVSAASLGYLTCQFLKHLIYVRRRAIEAERDELFVASQRSPYILVKTM